MATPLQSPRAFNALSGEEIKAAILADIKRALDNDYHFKAHLSYPLVTWKWAFAADAYPPEVGHFETGARGTLTSSQPRPIDDEEEEPEHIELSAGRDVSAPQGGQTADSLRRDTGQQVPQPRIVSGPENSRVLVESVPQTEDEKASAAAEAGKTASQSDTRNPVARRAAVRTRANPKGISAPDPQGTPPRPKEAAQIAERVAKEELE